MSLISIIEKLPALLSELKSNPKIMTDLNAALAVLKDLNIASLAPYIAVIEEIIVLLSAV